MALLPYGEETSGSEAPRKKYRCQDLEPCLAPKVLHLVYFRAKHKHARDGSAPERCRAPGVPPNSTQTSFCSIHVLSMASS